MENFNNCKRIKKYKKKKMSTYIHLYYIRNFFTKIFITIKIIKKNLFRIRTEIYINWSGDIGTNLLLPVRIRNYIMPAGTLLKKKRKELHDFLVNYIKSN